MLDLLNWKKVSLVLWQVIGPGVHKSVIFHLVWIAHLILEHLSTIEVIEVYLNSRKIVEWVKVVVALLW